MTHSFVFVKYTHNQFWMEWTKALCANEELSCHFSFVQIPTFNFHWDPIFLCFLHNYSQNCLNFIVWSFIIFHSFHFMFTSQYTFGWYFIENNNTRNWTPALYTTREKTPMAKIHRKNNNNNNKTQEHNNNKSREVIIWYKVYGHFRNACFDTHMYCIQYVFIWLKICEYKYKTNKKNQREEKQK